MSLNKVKRFEDLIVWQKARILAKEVYLLSKRNGNKEFRQFLSIAKGSAGELCSQFYRIYDREILNEEEFKYYIYSVVEISKMLNSILNRISSSNFKGTKYK